MIDVTVSINDDVGNKAVIFKSIVNALSLCSESNDNEFCEQQSIRVRKDDAMLRGNFIMFQATECMIDSIMDTIKNLTDGYPGVNLYVDLERGNNIIGYHVTTYLIRSGHKYFIKTKTFN